MSQYRVQLKQGSRTVVEYVEASDTASILSFYDLISTMKVTEILKIEYSYSGDLIPPDDFNYQKLYKGFVKDTSSNLSRQYIIHNVKPTKNENDIASALMSHFKIDGGAIDSVYCSLIKAD